MIDNLRMDMGKRNIIRHTKNAEENDGGNKT